MSQAVAGTSLSNFLEKTVYQFGNKIAELLVFFRNQSLEF